ncbi:hypothetical protein L1987_02915 [Smallanthus sonchifolius]|uniref:Uncharacterized protein n=1 Tax=Smallanthus sonchifolius TaxID=185202 RepID=A0ACB9K9C2_9ASTR|nr:hypothetical protein L1987_02915 [Smallanthus sonchifolius]
MLRNHVWTKVELSVKLLHRFTVLYVLQCVLYLESLEFDLVRVYSMQQMDMTILWCLRCCPSNKFPGMSPPVGYNYQNILPFRSDTLCRVLVSKRGEIVKPI